jgi:hypothetical protein
MPRLPITLGGAFAALLLAGSPAAAAPDPTLAQALQSRTQALVDALGQGDKAVWDAALDPGVTIVDDGNHVLTKAQVLGGIGPQPEGQSGQIRVANFQLDREGATAIATYINDESLDYQGQLVRTKYRVLDVWMQRGADWKLVASHSSPIVDEPPVATLPEAVLKQYVGQYELTFDIHYRVDLVNGKLIGQRQGGKLVELKPEATDVFFLAGAPRTRRIFQHDPSGAVTGFVDRREGHDIVWKKVQ